MTVRVRVRGGRIRGRKEVQLRVRVGVRVVPEIMMGMHAKATRAMRGLPNTKANVMPGIRVGVRVGVGIRLFVVADGDTLHRMSFEEESTNELTIRVGG